MMHILGIELRFRYDIYGASGDCEWTSRDVGSCVPWPGGLRCSGQLYLLAVSQNRLCDYIGLETCTCWPSYSMPLGINAIVNMPVPGGRVFNNPLIITAGKSIIVSDSARSRR